MKKIGFVDYYISEWHAENYPAWIKAASERLGGEEMAVAYAYAERDTSPLNGETTAEWCARHGVEMCESIDELCEKSDFIIVLAPSNPEVHPRLSAPVLAYGKPTYIDKTFADSYADAEFIFAEAAKSGAPFFSTSALRYASELDGKCGYTEICTTGGGSNAPEYIIHQVEMVVKTLGIGAEGVSCDKEGDELVFRVSYPDSRTATMRYNPDFAFSASLSGGEKEPCKLQIESDFFAGLIEDILRFFTTKTLPFNPEETLEVMKIREWAVKAMA